RDSGRGHPISSMLFFFSSRRRHTRWPRDWSSDVCSSDLPGVSASLFPAGSLAHLSSLSQIGLILFMFLIGAELNLGELRRRGRKIGRASCRERVEIAVVSVALKKEQREWRRE